jgi:hypothetical protein
MATDQPGARGAGRDRAAGGTSPVESAEAGERGDARDDGDAGDDSKVGARIFLGLAVYFVLLAVIYALVSDEEYAGVVLLLLAGGLSILTGTFLEYGRRHGLRQELEREDYERPGELYLPPTSTHPVVMGGGIILLAAGLALGIWVLLPGAMLFVFGLYGLVQESRARE